MSVQAHTHRHLTEQDTLATSLEDTSLEVPSLEEEWPGLFDTVDSPIRAAIARRILSRAVARLPLRIEFPNGTRIGAGGDNDPLMTIHRPRQFFARLGADAKIGFGESYMAGDWDAAPGTDLADLLTPLAANVATLVPPSLQRLRRLVERRQPAAEQATIPQAQENIRRHYDLSNELFAAFLDETLSYSSALFDAGDDLAAAQRRKIDAILDRAAVRSGTTMLEIGTGWGELAIRAAQRGAEVTTVTLSTEQRDLAIRRVADAGLSDHIRILLCDYREVTGHYDAIVSVEMLEAVGQRYWPDYFSTLDRLLRPGGRIGLQTITMPHDRMVATQHSYSWIHKYIFPGGIIPSIHAIEGALQTNTSLMVTERHDFGSHYATTLRLWRQRFLTNWSTVAGHQFDSVFKRMWEFYLAYCEAGFLAGYLGVSQFSLTRSPNGSMQ